MVSVIIPTFNSQKYISLAIDSVLYQTYTNFEIIVIDDGSTDNTRDILKPYFDKIEYIQQANNGPASARNTGILAARGKYIAFLDSDDIWLPEKLSYQVQYLKKNQEFGLVYCDEATFDESGIIDANSPLSLNKPRPEGYIFQELILNSLIHTSTVIVRKDVFAEVGLFDETFLLGEDYDLWLRISAQYRIGHVRKVLSKYRQHSSSLTYLDLGPQKPWDIRVIEKNLSLFPEQRKKISFSQLKKRVAKVYFTFGYSAFRKKQFATARWHFRHSLLNWPANSRAFAYYLACVTWPHVALSIIK